MRIYCNLLFFFFSSRRRHTRLQGDWSSDVCSSDLIAEADHKRIHAAFEILRAGHTPAAAAAEVMLLHVRRQPQAPTDRKSTRLNSSHLVISYAVFCLKKKKQARERQRDHHHRRDALAESHAA